MAYKRDTPFVSEEFPHIFLNKRENLIVQVIAVIFEKRDQLRQLSKMDMA